jgi:hypothetical protein
VRGERKQKMNRLADVFIRTGIVGPKCPGQCKSSRTTHLSHCSVSNDYTFDGLHIFWYGLQVIKRAGLATVNEKRNKDKVK